MLAVCMTLIDNDKDQTSFEDFYYRNRQIAYAFAYKILNNSALAEEACANAFFSIAKCFKKIHNYSLHDMDAYLIRTIRNACYAIYNKENQNPTSSIFDLKVEDEPSEDFYDDIDLDLLIDAVRKLDDKLKSVIAYKVYYDLTADEIAKDAEFFCFGTNDLTQMTYGFSRDDAGKFLNAYYDAKIFENDPFAKLDQTGVGKLMEMAIKLGKAERPTLHVGICGEHGGPSSVEFCHKIGLDYVSCSPFRVPIARLAAAQAAIAEK